MTLTSLQRSMLAELAQAGHAELDRAGRLCTGPLRRPIPGDSSQWLVLVAAGYVGGERGIIMPTELGREAAANFGSGRVREGA